MCRRITRSYLRQEAYNDAHPRRLPVASLLWSNDPQLWENCRSFWSRALECAFQERRFVLFRLCVFAFSFFTFITRMREEDVFVSPLWPGKRRNVTRGYYLCIRGTGRTAWFVVCLETCVRWDFGCWTWKGDLWSGHQSSQINQTVWHINVILLRDLQQVALFSFLLSSPGFLQSDKKIICRKFHYSHIVYFDRIFELQKQRPRNIHCQNQNINRKSFLLLFKITLQRSERLKTTIYL